MYIIHYSTKVSKALFVYICAFTDVEAIEKFKSLSSELSSYAESVSFIGMDKIIWNFLKKSVDKAFR